MFVSVELYMNRFLVEVRERSMSTSFLGWVHVFKFCVLFKITFYVGFVMNWFSYQRRLHHLPSLRLQICAALWRLRAKKCRISIFKAWKELLTATSLRMKAGNF